MIYLLVLNKLQREKIFLEVSVYFSNYFVNSSVQQSIHS